MKKITLKILIIVIAVFGLNTQAQHCAVSSSLEPAYNVADVTTTGGSININYAGANGTGNYLSSTETLTIPAGEIFNLAITNGNGWSRSIAYIDWNGDDDFEDAGERLPAFSPEKTYTGDPGETYNMNVTVPGGAVVGLTKMRVLSGDAWTYNDDVSGSDPDGPGIPTIPCGDFSSASWKDFNVQIETALGVNDFDQDMQFAVFPNPIKGDVINLRMNIQNQDINVELYNIIGKRIHSFRYKSFNKQEVFQLPSYLNKGVYLLKVSFENKIHIQKLVK